MTDSTGTNPAGGTRWLVKLPDGNQYGPADEATLAAWADQGRIPKDAALVPESGGASVVAWEHPTLGPRVVQAASRIPDPNAGDATGGLIPYKNGAALASYYVGIGSLAACFLPPLGIITGIVAVVLGVVGLKKHKANPTVKGSAHAWIGIALGAVVVVLDLAAIVVWIVAIANGGY